MTQIKFTERHTLFARGGFWI